MKALPEGKSLGWMQAPASWISSHTVRFIGVVRVVIQDGEGFILIKKGKPLFHYFRQGAIELKGHAALDYFNSHPVIEFNLCKYTPDEFAWAMKLCNIEDHEPVVPKDRAASGPVLPEHNLPSRTADPPPAKPAGDRKIPEPVAASSPQVRTDIQRAVVPQPVVSDDPEVTILSQIRDLNGIIAIAVFNEKRTIIMMGDADSEALVKIARTMLETAKKMAPRLTWGPFVHMTIQIPAGNMIIAPYHDNNLCMLTTRTINIGQIRRILRDLQQKAAPSRDPD
jgi:predicted regulator of Ras-like GTPase activity (Roadblock/LC7/MglB family)